MNKDLQKIEQHCHKLIAAKNNEERSEVLSDSIGYFGLAQAYVYMCDLYRKEQIKNCDHLK